MDGAGRKRLAAGNERSERVNAMTRSLRSRSGETGEELKFSGPTPSDSARHL